MSKFINYLEIILVFVSVPFVFFNPDYIIDGIFALYAAIVLDIMNRNLINIKILNIIYKNIRSYINERNMKKYLEKEQLIEYRNTLIENALIRATSVDRDSRIRGLKQLEQFGNDKICDRLLRILKSTNDKTHERDILKTLSIVCRK
ncbi:MAG: hypothetical protein C3F06_05825 [Candidatus Methanoperedenaceae archaeon]|nr:MAG: hypothetical protein C3F06_05825 [Candidatus Methanoperedenaceae archaeon]